LERSRIFSKGWIGILGALDGIMFSAILLLYIKVENHYLEWRNFEDSQRIGENPPQIWSPSPNAWVIIVLLCITFTVGSLLIYRILPKLREKPVVFWVLVGVVSIVLWNLFLICGTTFGELGMGRPLTVNSFATIVGFLKSIVSFALVVFLNVVFGFSLKLSCRVG
jgi:hypothetical protein